MATSNVDVLPEVKEILGAMLFAAKQPLSVKDMRRVLKQVAEESKDAAADFGKVTEKELLAVVEDLTRSMEAAHIGLHVVEVAHGFRLANDARCGPWLRRLLEKGKPNRLSPSALETLAIIAYRQPVTRGEIESVRGVDVTQMTRNLLELQLIRMVGRSELPGRPWLLGTTQKFLEHFGLKNLDDLPGKDELQRLEEEQQAKIEKEPAEPDAEPGKKPVDEDKVVSEADEEDIFDDDDDEEFTD